MSPSPLPSPIDRGSRTSDSKTIYLDNHSTTPVDPRVLNVMWPWFAEYVGNAASVSHELGRRAAQAVGTAREQVAIAIGATPAEIIFTSGATEANNLAIKGVINASRGNAPLIADVHLITTVAEHRAVLDPVDRLRRQGCRVTLLPVDEFARLDVSDVGEALTDDTRLVSVMLANNEVGTINPITEVGRLCHKRNVPLHTDAAQAVGRIPVCVDSLSVDLLSLSAHKLYGPQGVGALYVRKTNPPLRLTPLLDGGGHERRLRSGTLPVALIVGFGEACRLAHLEQVADHAQMETLRDRLKTALLMSLDGITINGHPTQRLPGNLNVSIAGVDGVALLASLVGLAVSSGSACTSADREPSHVLRAMGVTESLSLASLRFGIGRFNTAHDIDRAAEIVVQAVHALR